MADQPGHSSAEQSTEATLAQRMRLHIYEHFVEHTRPPVVEELMSTFGLTRADTVAVLRELEQSRHIALVKGTARILMAFPLSAIATQFRVAAGGRDYFANCAWDAVAFHAMLGTDTDIRVESYCHHCAMPILVEMSGGRAVTVQPETTIIYLALRPTQWWEDIITTCSNTMVFFCSAEHRAESGLAGSPDEGVSLTPQQVHDLGVPLYGPRLAMDYARPGREELMAHFTSLGHTSPYWQI